MNFSNSTTDNTEKLKDRICLLYAILRGWSNYHKHVVASHAFSTVNNSVYLLLQLWAKHRHSNKTVGAD